MTTLGSVFAHLPSPGRLPGNKCPHPVGCEPHGASDGGALWSFLVVVKSPGMGHKQGLQSRLMLLATDHPPSQRPCGLASRPAWDCSLNCEVYPSPVWISTLDR